MRLGVVSDTHGHVPLAEKAARVLRAGRVELVIHCGDIGTAHIPFVFTEWPTHYVFGNTDWEPALLRGAIRDAEGICHERFGELTLAGCRIAILHGDDQQRFHEAVHSGSYDLVCYGHTHRAKVEKYGQTTVLNPGALYRATPHQIAIVELPAMAVAHLDIDSWKEPQ